MALRKITFLALAFALPLLMIPSAAQADGLTFHFSNTKGGCISFGMTPGTNLHTLGGPIPFSPTLTTVGTTNTGVHFTGQLGTVNFSTGNFLAETFFGGHPTSLTYAPGGVITVVSAVAMGVVPAGTTLFTGTFSGNVLFKTTNPNQAFANWTLFGTIKALTVNKGLLTMLGLPGQIAGSLSAITMDIGWKPAGGCLNGGDIILTPSPEPGTLLLFGSGMLSIAGALRHRLKK